MALVWGGAPTGSQAIYHPEDYLDYVTTESGLQFLDVTEGSGDYPTPGQNVKVHYEGLLNGFERPDGPRATYCGETLQVPPCKFDSSYASRWPLDFAVGTGKVIKGWDEGLLTMRPGGKRRLVVPAALAYGKRGAGNIIPPNAVLYFEVELLAVSRHEGVFG